MNRFALALLLATVPDAAAAQVGYRLRLDARVQAVSYRGLTPDSIPVTDTVTGPGGGPGTASGYAAYCVAGEAYCSFYRPGPELRAVPLETEADLSLWGFGVPGLSARIDARLGTDLGNATTWPGTEPAVQLKEGYVEYARDWLLARGGRQIVSSRLGYLGFDGGYAVVRDSRHGLEADGYAGWGLARGSLLPVTSPDLNPLDEFRPAERTVVAGVDGGWSGSRFDLRANYRREVDPTVSYFVSERAAAQAVVYPLNRVTLQAGSDWDLAAGEWGSAEASASYAAPRVNATAGVRRYRPYFDLWSIWMAFSPVPYHTWFGQVGGRPVQWLELRGRYERYAFDPTEVSTALVNVKNDGWRYEVGGTITRAAWTLDAGWHGDFGPGASSSGLSASASYALSRWRLTAFATGFDRPLELRYEDAKFWSLGLDAQTEISPTLRCSLGAAYYKEDRQRPDAGGVDWSQLRLNAQVTLVLGRAADMLRLPKAVRRQPGGRAAR